MVKIFIIGFVSCLLSVGLKAQTIKDNVSVKWNNCDDSHPYMSVSNQAGETVEGLPLIVLQYPLEMESVLIDDIILNVRTTEEKALNATESVLIEKIDMSLVQLIDKRVVTIRKKKFLEISFVPLTFDETLKVYNKILSLELSLTLPDVNSNLSVKSGKSAAVASNSVLSTGRWVKVSISESGVYKIPYSVLESWGFSNAQDVNVFGNGGNMLPKNTSTFRYDDLHENAVMHYNNAIYFYAQGTVTWSFDKQRNMFVHQLHDYTDEAYYYLTEDAGLGKRIQATSEVFNTYTNETEEYDSYTYYELELNNLLHSGRNWYGEQIENGNSRNYDFSFPHLNTEEPVSLLTSGIGHSSSTSYIQTFVNGSSNALQNISIPYVVYGTQTGSVAQSGIAQSSFYSNSSRINLTYQYSASASGSYSYLDYYCLNAKEFLYLDDQLTFRNKDIVGLGNITRFYLENTSANSVLWDVSDHTTPVRLELDNYGDRNGFTASSENLKEFVVFDPSANLPQPSRVEEVVNQDLHGVTVPEMLIVVHPLFKDQAIRLAQLHNQKSGLECLIVEPQQIYNEFSSGQPDVSAIRDFARFLY